MTDQPRLFDGWEVAAEYVHVPGVTKNYPLRKLMPVGTDPHHGDVFEAVIRFRMAYNADAKFTNAGDAQDINEVWQAVPIADTVRVLRYVSRDELEQVWATEHGQVG